MNVPLILLIGTIVSAGISFLARAQAHRAAWFGAGGAFLLGIFTLFVPLEEAFDFAILQVRFNNTFQLLGRALLLDEPARGFIGFLFLLTAILLASSAYAGTNRFFPSLVLLLTGVCSAAMMMKPFLYAAILMELAAMLAVLILVAPEYPARRAAMRLLFVFTLAMMAILLAGWLLGVVGVTGATPEIARWTAALLAVGFAVLMAVPPFHYWLSVASDESHPYVVVTLLLFMQTLGVFFLLRFLDTYEWLRAQPSTFQGIRLAGVVMVLFGSLMMLGQRRMTRVIAYAMIADLGVILMAAGMGDAPGLELMMQLNAARVPGIVLWTTSLTALMRTAGDDTLDQLQGVAHRHRLRVMFIIIGMAAVFSVPFAASFPGRWMLLDVMAGTDALGVITMLAGWFINAIVLVRWYLAMRGNGVDGEAQEKVREGSFILNIIQLALVLVLGLFPQAVLPWMETIIDGLSNLLSS